MVEFLKKNNLNNFILEPLHHRFIESSVRREHNYRYCPTTTAFLLLGIHLLEELLFGGLLPMKPPFGGCTKKLPIFFTIL
ncbi:hypothetical protein CENA302_09675 [Cylindrospermopsis raciborskii CENA302]|uniref:Uncharacterized protein n=1 Tax=Cylindrospermopsis raciborskii CENA302 TaxID=1170768 RepID=A0A9Q5QWD0_9CYAN|nr:hypothetical protein BCV64_02335 [Cylindrospermopsis raciborskii MVCC14]OPH09698.1 hypothetical protein CENA302_09675 [Cylindrospermopsis raciborskii CENA302]